MFNSYLIKIEKKDIEKISNLEINRIYSDNETIIFYSNSRTIKELNNRHILFEQINIRKRKIKNIITKYLISIIGSLSLLLILICMSKSITKIKFVDDYYYNQEIYDYVKEKVKRKLLFYYLDESINEINSDLRSKFYQYEWIGINKRGTTLYIDAKGKNIDENKNGKKSSGNYFSSDDGIVKTYHLEKGIILVQEEQYVSKGELLISGEIIHYNHEVEYIRPNGYVLADVLKYEEIEIPISDTNLIRTGRIQIDRVYSIGKFTLFKDKEKFESYQTEIINIKKFFNFISIDEIHYYEIKEVNTVYTLEEAIDYGKTLITKNFISEKTIPNEKIYYINFVEANTTNDTYVIKYLVKSYKNIAKYVPNS